MHTRYLFAAVAGQLGCIEDTFTTMSGRAVRLKVWSEPDNVDALAWSMQCLKDAMTWDEQTYGREYDLDVYHVVAVNASSTHHSSPRPPRTPASARLPYPCAESRRGLHARLHADPLLGTGL